jgi:hypothetical protein
MPAHGASRCRDHAGGPERRIWATATQAAGWCYARQLLTCDPAHSGARGLCSMCTRPRRELVAECSYLFRVSTTQPLGRLASQSVLQHSQSVLLYGRPSETNGIQDEALDACHELMELFQLLLAASIRVLDLL